MGERQLRSQSMGERQLRSRSMATGVEAAPRDSMLP